MLPFSAEFEKQVLALAGSPEIEAREKAAQELGGATMVPKLT